MWCMVDDSAVRLDLRPRVVCPGCTGGDMIGGGVGVCEGVAPPLGGWVSKLGAPPEFVVGLNSCAVGDNESNSS